MSDTARPHPRHSSDLSALSTAEAPLVIEHREALIYLLCDAAELEHGLMCEYLFAAFSLKQRTDEGLTVAQLAAVDRWRQALFSVAGQEMLHLATACNLLSAIGAAPHLVRPNLPQPARHYPAGVQLLLLPFGEAALRHFMYLERPEGMALQDAAGIAASQHALPAIATGDLVPRLQQFATVGHLYRSIAAGFRRLSEKWGEASLFLGPPEAQVGPEVFQWPALRKVVDLQSALAAIATVVEQGEGASGDWREAHFGRFSSVFEEYQGLRAADPSFIPVRPVQVSTVWPPEDADPAIAQEAMTYGDRHTAQVIDLFNIGYELLLQALHRLFSRIDETPAQVQILADVAVGLMFEVIQRLGQLISELPAGPEAPGKTAGASFELFYTSDYLLPHGRAAWAILAERLGQAGVFAQGLGARPELATVAAAFRRFAAQIDAGRRN